MNICTVYMEALELHISNLVSINIKKTFKLGQVYFLLALGSHFPGNNQSIMLVR